MLRIGTLLFSLFIAATARGEPPRGVLIVDEVRFTPTLERSGAHQKMLDGVKGTLTLHGWQGVPSADCHDLTCIGPAAAAAQVNYALVLMGAYAGGQEMYANDVGVSLWRDGSVVARWTEKEEQAEAERTATGEFFPCGPPNGTCVAPLLTSKMQQYSARLVEAESAAIHQREAALAVPPKPAATSAPVLVAPSAAPATSGSGVGRIVGWSLVGVGVAALVTGLSIWAIDGHPSNDCASAGAAHVCKAYDTTTTGVILTAVGAAAGVAGGLLVWRAESDRAPQLAVGLGSLLVRGRF